MFHLLNGVRHLFWDAGRGFERTQRHASGWIAVLGSLLSDVRLLGLVLAPPVMSLRSPLGRVLGMGSAKDGTGHWWAQRVSAVALIPLTLWFVFSLLTLPAFDYDTVRTWLSVPFSGFLAVLLVAVLTYHSYLGTIVIVEDYVTAAGMKVLTLLVLRFLYVLCGGRGHIRDIARRVRILEAMSEYKFIDHTLRCGRRRRRRRRIARYFRFGRGRSRDGLSDQGVSDAQPHRGGAGRHLGGARQHGRR